MSSGAGRQCRRLHTAVHAESPLVDRRTVVVVHRRRQPVARREQPIYALEVGDRPGGQHVGAETGWCVHPYAFVEGVPGGSAELLGEHPAETIVPRDRQLVDDVGEPIEVRKRPVGPAHGQRDPRQDAGTDE